MDCNPNSFLCNVYLDIKGDVLRIKKKEHKRIYLLPHYSFSPLFLLSLKVWKENLVFLLALSRVFSSSNFGYRELLATHFNTEYLP